jgi:integrase
MPKVTTRNPGSLANRTFCRKGPIFDLNKKSMIGCPALSPQELKLALANLKGRFALRDRALVTLGVRTGLRISELLALKVGQMWDGKTTVARFYVARQATKGKHAGASIVMHPDAAKAVARWIKAGGLAANPGSYLFPSQKGPGRRLGRKSAWEILHPAFQRAGVTGMAGTHCLRKTFANNVHQALGGDLFRTSKAMRHSSPLTTLRYLSFKQEDIDRAILSI